MALVIAGAHERAPDRAHHLAGGLRERRDLLVESRELGSDLDDPALDLVDRRADDRPITTAGALELELEAAMKELEALLLEHERREPRLVRARGLVRLDLGLELADDERGPPAEDALRYVHVAVDVVADVEDLVAREPEVRLDEGRVAAEIRPSLVERA